MVWRWLTAQDQALTERRELLAQLTSLTTNGSLRWERQARSAHRYARWNNNLLILGPTAPLEDHKIPRYLFLTPFSSPTGIEISSEDATLRPALLELVYLIFPSSLQRLKTLHLENRYAQTQGLNSPTQSAAAGVLRNLNRDGSLAVSRPRKRSDLL